MTEDLDSQRLRAKLAELQQEFGVEAIAALLAPPEAPAKRGRPKGSGYDDRPALLHMDRLLETGETASEREAARRSAHLTRGNSPEAIEDRLRRKYRKHRKLLLRVRGLRRELGAGIEEARRLTHEAVRESVEGLARLQEMKARMVASHLWDKK